MKKVGIICDLEYTRHPCFRNYYHAIVSIYGLSRIVKTPIDLDGLDILFIGDDHWFNHKTIWQQPEFIDKCNTDKIKIVVFTTEKILNSHFPWNTENLEFLRKFNEVYHYTIDVDDCIELGTKLNRIRMSKRYKDYIEIPDKKIDKVVFIGNIDCACSSYEGRIKTLEEIKGLMPLYIIPPTMETWEEYMATIAKYRFVLSPLGNGNLFPMRFYEILLIKSIPIQQVKENTLQYYDTEAGLKDCIYFQEASELPEKIKNFTSDRSNTELWLEDYIEGLLKEENLI